VFIFSSSQQFAPKKLFSFHVVKLEGIAKNRFRLFVENGKVRCSFKFLKIVFLFPRVLLFSSPLIKIKNHKIIQQSPKAIEKRSRLQSVEAILM